MALRVRALLPEPGCSSPSYLPTYLVWVNHKSRFEFVHVRLGEWLGWPQASPREPLRCHISSLVIVETLKDSFEDLANKTDTTMVTSKRKFDFEG